MGAIAFLLLAADAQAAPIKTEVTKAPIRRGIDVKPLPPDKAPRTHAPFQSGQCGVCHVNNDAQKPGPIRHASVNEQCFECHDDVREIMKRRYTHVPAREACTHCHNPHASNIERILIALPFDLCVTCHSKDAMVASDGKQMTNYKKWLAENRIWHDPVRAKDCSACHRTHAGDNFRLLVAEYPRDFYAPYERKNYALCYGCHNDKVISVEQTTTLTAFRDGSRNLHYVHVNRDRGRTCRACHEVHASKQAHHIRDGVPYGAKGWILKIGYTRLPTGGSCVKTCHDEKTYNNKTLTSSATKK
jgi:predicted CXXCH cytochrome family protein